MASSADYAVLKISQTSYLTSSRSSVLIILDSECAGRIQMSDILDGPHAEAFSWEKSMEAYLAEEIRERNFLGVLANLRRHGWVPTMSQSLLRPADPDEPNPQQILLRTYYFERSFGAASGAGSANGGLAGLGGAGNGAGSSSLPPPPSNLPSANGSSGGGGGSGGDSGAGSGGANGVQRAAGPTGADQPPTDAIAEKPKTQPPPFRRPAGPPPGNPPPIQRQASNFSSRPGRTPPPPPPIARQQSKDLDRRQALNSLIPATPPASPGHRANRAASTGPVPPVSQGNFGAAPEEDAPYPESHARSPGTHAHTRSMDARQREQLAARNAAYFEDMRRKKQLEDAEREAEEARLPPEEREKIRRKREEAKAHNEARSKHLQKFTSSYANPGTKALLGRGRGRRVSPRGMAQQ